MKKYPSRDQVAYRGGWRAFVAGKSASDCPYMSQRLRGQWLSGYGAAASDSDTVESA